MKSVKLALVLGLILAFVVNIAFTANKDQTRRLPRPERSFDKSDLVKGGKIASSSHSRFTIPRETEPIVGRAMKLQGTPHTVKRTTTGVIPPGFPVTGLHGSFTVGAGGAISDLNLLTLIMSVVNVDGPVTFLLTDPSYIQAGIVIGPTVGASATNTITIRPAAGNTNCVMSFVDNPDARGGLVLDGAQYVIIEGTAVGQPAGTRNLTIELSAPPSPVTDAPVLIANSLGAAVSDCIIPGYSESQSWEDGNGSVTLVADSGMVNSYVTVNNCELTGGTFGVIEYGNYPATYDEYGVQDDNTTVSNCWIHDVIENGVNLQQVSYAHVAGNLVSRVNFGTAGLGGHATLGKNIPNVWRPSGIQVWGDYALIERNRVDSVVNNRAASNSYSATAYGIRILGFGNNDPDPSYGGTGSFVGIASYNLLINNIVTRIYAMGGYALPEPGSAIGIEVESGRMDTLYHNTVYFSGTNPATGNVTCLETWGTHSTTTGRPAWYGGTVITGSNSPARTYVKNNIFAIDRSGTSGHNNIFAITQAGTVDYRAGSDNNVLYNASGGNIAILSPASGSTTYSSVYGFYAYNSTDAHSQADGPTLTSETDVHISASGHSTADTTGANLTGRVPVDFAGTTRAIPHPNIGAYEGHGAGAPLDTKGLALVSPGPAGAPAGLVFKPIIATFQNLGAGAATAVPVHVDIFDPSMVLSASFNNTVNIPGLGVVNDTFAGTWTPGVGGNYTVNVYTVLPGDNYPGNDMFTITVPVAGQSIPPYVTGFESPADRLGWFGTGDWKLGSTSGGDTKLGGGAHGGDMRWVTLPGAAGTIYSAAQVNYLYTPYFDFTHAAGAIMSFYQAMQTEPEWDRSIMEYSLDTGHTWNTVGVLNDPAGINWYATTVYNNAAGVNGFSCFDSATARPDGFPAAHPGALMSGFWTSNGSCTGADVATGPNGYVFVQYDLSNVPGLLGKSFVRFRYASFSDASGTYDGWAIDDFQITPTAVLNAANITGTVYFDANGDGIDNGGELGLAGDTVRLSYFGVHQRDTVTDVNGFYHFRVGLPGVYSLVADIPAGGYATTQPRQPLTYNNINYPGNGTDMTGKNIGLYQGWVAGNVFSDLNDNGVFNVGEPGIAGYTVQAHNDSVTGAVIGSGSTDTLGNYRIALPPGPYKIVPVIDTTLFRQTMPASQGVYTVTVSGNSGSGTALETVGKFGDYVYTSLTILSNNDVNANGHKDLLDYNPGPTTLSGGIAVFDLYHGTKHFAGPDTIGGGVGLDRKTITGLDTGLYVAVMSYLTPGWLNTSPPFVVRTYYQSGLNAVDTFMVATFFVSGTVYRDANGNGTKDAADTSGYSGITVNVHTTHNGNKTGTTDAKGNYQVAGILPPDSAYVSLTVPSGYVLTSTPAIYAFYDTSSGSYKYANFGLFKSFNISGTVYRDRNANGVRDPGEEGLVRTIMLSTKTGQSLDTSLSTGAYSFANIGLGADTLSEVLTGTWVVSSPAGNSYKFMGASGSNVVENFGTYEVADTGVKFRTFTANEYYAAYGTKAATWQSKQAKVVMPNLITALVELGKNPGIVVGEVGVTGRGYILPGAYGDLLKTFYGKLGMKDSVTAATPARGLDFYTGNVKPIIKGVKSLPPDQQNNIMVADLMALKTNIKLSDNGNTAAHFGDLIYNEVGNSLSGLSISRIATNLDTLMTNWTTVYSVYTNYDTVIQKINKAFSGAFDTTHWNTVKPGFVVIKGVKSVPQVSFLMAPTTLVPRTTPQQAYVFTPPANFALLQNYPNPFNPTTSIPFDLPQQSVVTLKIYNMLGQEVSTLIDHQTMDADRQEVTFDASAMPSGVYFYRIMATGISDGSSTAVKNFTQVKKMMLLK